MRRGKEGEDGGVLFLLLLRLQRTREEAVQCADAVDIACEAVQGGEEERLRIYTARRPTGRCMHEREREREQDAVVRRPSASSFTAVQPRPRAQDEVLG